MNIRFLFLAAAALAAAAVSVVAYLLLPETVWTPPTLVALALFCLAVGLTVWFPFALSNPAGRSDAARMASIGPLSLLILTLLGWTGLAFLVGAIGFNTATWAMIVVAVALFLAAFLSWSGAARIVDQVGQRDGPSRIARWTEQLSRIAAGMSEPEAAGTIERLKERIRYAGSGSGNVDGEVDMRIEALLGEMERLDESGASGALGQMAVRFERLLDEREALLRMARTKA